jgi:hypothetical protein
VLAGLAWPVATPRLLADDPKPEEPTALNDLSMEVAALLALHRFEFTPPQLEALRRIVPETAQKPGGREPGKGSARLRQGLTELRNALLSTKRDEERINDLEEQLVDLHNAGDTDLDDTIDITEAARRRAPDFLRVLSPRQVTAYLSDLGDALPDPLERLLEALDKAPQLRDPEWKELSEEIADEVSWLLGGLDKKKAGLVRVKVNQWLVGLRSLKEKDLQQKRPELEKAARLFVAQVPPTAVLHNIAEHALAELLSNPRLAAALEARRQR